jgi:UDP-N-acetylmuramate-alanine ligase
LPKQVMPQDVVVTLGAGDISRFSTELAETLK